MRWRRALLLGLVVPALVVVGCGDGGGEVDATATIAPLVAGRFNSPNSLETYRWSAKLVVMPSMLPTENAPPGLGLEGKALTIKLDGARENPEREWVAMSLDYDYLSLDRETIVIGSRIWSKESAGAWRERATLNSPEDFLATDAALSPSQLLGGEDNALLQRFTDEFQQIPYTREHLNGRDTRHWLLEGDYVRDVLASMDSPVPELVVDDTAQLMIDVWTDVETGIAVRLVVVAGTDEAPEGFRLQLDLWALNDADISVEEPVGALRS